MKSKMSQLFVSVMTALVCAVALVSCGGGGSDLQPPSTDLTGSWSVQEIINGNCIGSHYPEYKYYTATVSQSGNNFTYTNTSDNSVTSGTISGTSISMNKTETDTGGTTTSSLSGTVASDGNSFSGTATWNWTGSSSSCSGTSQVTAARI
jgi:hypothetical protein